MLEGRHKDICLQAHICVSDFHFTTYILWKYFEAHYFWSEIFNILIISLWSMWVEIKLGRAIYFTYFTSEDNFLLNMWNALSLKIPFINEPGLNTVPVSSKSLVLWAQIHWLLSVYGLADAKNWSETALIYETQMNTCEDVSLTQDMQGITTDERIIRSSFADWM
jgi:hypothetical protein